MAFIASLILLYFLFKLVEIYMPRIIHFSRWALPRLKHELDELMDNIRDLIPGFENREGKVVRQEIHHHYAPQYDHSHGPQNITRTTNISNTQTISDSVYYSKGEGTGGQSVAGSCMKCGTSLGIGWLVCPVCTQPIGHRDEMEHY